ncbi:MAG TPA: fatty acyl-AMP ligase [Pyrinomonadaceae bacterium]|nr:fatty acyl-AMP ligase [Pyrinomonadaceae bacterium]
MCETTPETINDVLRRRAELTPQQRVFLFLEGGEREGASYTFAELDRKARAIGSRLAALGARGKRVLLPHPPGLDFVASFFGCLYSGAVAVPACSSLLSPRHHDRLRFIVEDADAEFILAASTHLQNLTDQEWTSRLNFLVADEVAETEGADWLPAPVRPDDVAYIQYTSGSTSSPKGVVISHRNVLSNQKMIQSAFRTSEASVVVSWLPHFHDMGLVGVVQHAVYAGMSVVLMAPLDFIRRPAQWLRAISKYRASISGGPNFAYDLCVERIKDEAVSELDLSSWSLAFNGSEAVKPDTIKRFVEKFGKAGFRRECFYPCYGLAEATLFVSSRAPSKPFLSRRQDEVISCGQGWDGERVLIVDPKTHRRCADGIEGEIWIAGPHVAKGYWRRPVETREIFEAQLSDTGEGPFLRTGDLGYLSGGEIHITGRLKELIILHGKNHYPQDIEATAAASHPLLRRDGGAAFSVEVAGREQLVLFQEVNRQTPLEKAFEIKCAIRQALAENRSVKPYSVVLFKPNTIPKTSSGKIKRSACRADFLQNSFAENIFS